MTPAVLPDDDTVTRTDMPEAAATKPADPSLVVRSHGLTDPGRLRESNQDQFLVASLTKALRIHQTSLAQQRVQHSQDQGHLFIIADGMGGHAGGEQASALAVDTIESFVLDTLKWFFHLKGDEADEAQAEFQRALTQADDRVVREAAADPSLHGMGTTLTIAYGLNRELFIVHVGDSRAYLLRNGRLHRRTRDHTLVQEMVRQGILTPEDATHHPLRHVITNVIGGQSPGVEVEAHKLHLEPGDVLLLCSDGLTDMLPDQEIGSILHAEIEPQAACERLIARANEAGGKDNITAIVARFDTARA